MNFIIETERLRLRPFTHADLQALRAMRVKEEVARYLGTSAIQTPEFIAERLDAYLECYRRYGYGVAAAEDKRSGALVGWSGLQPLEFGWKGWYPAQGETVEIEVGYGFDSPHWGKGYATEVAAAWLRYGFVYAKLPRIVAVASPENKSSWRVMEKLGMKYVTTEEHYGSVCVCYAITRGEFVPRGAFRLLENS
ncbi:MAG TPA: GNAT family N-acetyltransferase [Pyrinomonadaceae bacterium]|nr:GNAT family N-acetyltransferase [Pyrinomonadaceae bacterium]